MEIKWFSVLLRSTIQRYMHFEIELVSRICICVPLYRCNIHQSHIVILNDLRADYIVEMHRIVDMLNWSNINTVSISLYTYVYDMHSLPLSTQCQYANKDWHRNNT